MRSRPRSQPICMISPDRTTVRRALLTPSPICCFLLTLRAAARRAGRAPPSPRRRRPARQRQCRRGPRRQPRPGSRAAAKRRARFRRREARRAAASAAARRGAAGASRRWTGRATARTQSAISDRPATSSFSEHVLILYSCLSSHESQYCCTFYSNTSFHTDVSLLAGMRPPQQTAYLDSKCIAFCFLPHGSDGQHCACVETRRSGIPCAGEIHGSAEALLGETIRAAAATAARSGGPQFLITAPATAGAAARQSRCVAQISFA